MFVAKSSQVVKECRRARNVPAGCQSPQAGNDLPLALDWLDEDSSYVRRGRLLSEGPDPADVLPVERARLPMSTAAHPGSANKDKQKRTPPASHQPPRSTKSCHAPSKPRSAGYRSAWTDS